MISKHKIVIFYAVLTPMRQTLILDKELRTLLSQFIGGLDRSIAQSSTDTVSIQCQTRSYVSGHQI